MATNPDAAAAKSGGKVKVRVQRHHEDLIPNQIISLSAKEAEAAKTEGWGDPDPDAVAYAEANETQPEAAPEAKA